MKTNKCLHCYKPLLADEQDFHKQCCKKIFGVESPPELPYSSEDLFLLAEQVVQRGETIPGVQPKLSLELQRRQGASEKENRLTIMGVLGGYYILKPPNAAYSQLPENEHLSMLMAKEIFNIRIADCTLVRLLSGELAYLTKRMDRAANGEKYHMLDMFQILDAYDKYVGSMERVGKAIKAHSVNALLNLSEYFHLTLFCFLIGNNDMHLKNFSLLSKEIGVWELSPAYDLLNATIANPEDSEELALTLNAKKKKLKRKDLTHFGLQLGLTERQVENAFNLISQNISPALAFIDNSFLSDANKSAYKILLEQRFQILST
ncbi:HipA domain-containing protein [Chitinophaga sp. sic0106]|uniref:HipA domain-containing protein n=1 Tax=Chitinophaga sp. sic0106 TaxID=2854785 RepID=UPI001C464682|nr:HipA domain-containing protein [Chitinophaga sp. sic0106]MBV7531161.1 HipA domain-containing protein [Chitinophaga sp. sic0106]